VRETIGLVSISHSFFFFSHAEKARPSSFTGKAGIFEQF
jgi:hypothetical protein